MLLIASEFKSSCLLTKADKSCQIDEEDLYEVATSENDGSYHTARSTGGSLYFGSDENAEDGDDNSDDNDSFSSHNPLLDQNPIEDVPNANLVDTQVPEEALPE